MTRDVYKLKHQLQIAEQKEAELRAHLREAALVSVDKNGNDVFLEDVLEFDEKEWGEPHTFKIEKGDDGSVVISGSFVDIPKFCTVKGRGKFAKLLGVK